MTRQLTIGSMFSGYGGLDMAVEEVFGARTVWQAEWEDAPSKVLARHWPDVPNLRDVTTVDWSTVEPVDIITGGYPCQPFSQAGRRDGLNDERHLWPYVAEAMDTIRPTWGVFENVRGHLSLGLDQVIRDLYLLNYHVEWRVMKASDIGAPHRRERIFLLAKDNHAPVRGRPDRRRGIHRNPRERRIVPSPPQSLDGGQGPASLATDGQALWRQDQQLGGPERTQQGRVYVGGYRGTRSLDHSPGEAVVASEARTSGYLTALPDHVGVRREVAEWAPQMDRRNESESGRTEVKDPRSEQARPRPRAKSTDADREATGEVPSRPLVGRGRFPVWPGAIRWENADEWPDGRWSHLRASDVGAPHQRFRVFVLATRADVQDTMRSRSGWRSTQPGPTGSDHAPLGPGEGGGREGSAPADAEQLRRVEGRQSAPGEASSGRPPAVSGGRDRAHATDAELVCGEQGWFAAPGQSEDRGASSALSGRSGTRTIADPSRSTVREHPGGSPAQEAGAGSGDGPGDPHGERPTGERGQTPADPEGRGRGVLQRLDHGPTGGEVNAPWDSRPIAGGAAGPSTDWGPYAPAIHRWERLRGPAPAPTELTVRGKHRLSPLFVEWMMGLPAGWVTSIDISRNDQLKALGNGVVPQQAEAALRHMLTGQRLANAA